MAEKKVEELSTVEKVLKFFADNKKKLSVCGIAVLVCLVALVVSSFAISSSRDKAMIRVASLEERVYSVTEKGSEFDALVSDLEKETNGKNYTACKAAYLLGKLYFNVSDFDNAFVNYYKAYELNKEIYTAPLALVNAAVSAENNGDSDKAIDCYTLAIDYSESGVRGKALFNLGRIYMEKGNEELAATYFELVVDEEQFSEYAALAKNILAGF